MGTPFGVVAIRARVQVATTASRTRGAGIVRIGKAYSDGGDYVQTAEEHIQDMYADDLSSVVVAELCVVDDPEPDDLLGHPRRFEVDVIIFPRRA